MRKIIFGTGMWGKYAINEYGSENIAYLVDNDLAKLGGILMELKSYSLRNLETYAVMTTMK